MIYSLPQSLVDLLQHARNTVLTSATGSLPPRIRYLIYREIENCLSDNLIADSAIPALNFQRLTLETLAIRKVIEVLQASGESCSHPLFSQVERLREALLTAAFDTLSGQADDELVKALSDEAYALNNGFVYDGEPEEEIFFFRHYWLFDAAYTTLRHAQRRDHFFVRAFQKAAPDWNPTDYEIDVNAYDVAFKCLEAYAGFDFVDQYKAEKGREFWLWWLEVAIPQSCPALV